MLPAPRTRLVVRCEGEPKIEASWRRRQRQGRANRGRRWWQRGASARRKLPLLWKSWALGKGMPQSPARSREEGEVANIAEAEADALALLGLLATTDEIQEAPADTTEHSMVTVSAMDT